MVAVGGNALSLLWTLNSHQWWELNNTHKNALASLKDTKSVSDATKVFMDQFERPHKDYANFSKRLQYANSIS